MSPGTRGWELESQALRIPALSTSPASGGSVQPRWLQSHHLVSIRRECFPCPPQEPRLEQVGFTLLKKPRVGEGWCCRGICVAVWLLQLRPSREGRRKVAAVFLVKVRNCELRCTPALCGPPGDVGKQEPRYEACLRPRLSFGVAHCCWDRMGTLPMGGRRGRQVGSPRVDLEPLSHTRLGKRSPHCADTRPPLGLRTAPDLSGYGKAGAPS